MMRFASRNKHRDAIDTLLGRLKKKHGIKKMYVSNCQQNGTKFYRLYYKGEVILEALTEAKMSYYLLGFEAALEIFDISEV